MYKFIMFLVDLLIVGYCGYLALFKAEPTLKDIAFIGFVILTNVMINQSRLENK